MRKKPADYPQLDIPKLDVNAPDLRGHGNMQRVLDTKTGEYLPNKGRYATAQGVLSEPKLLWIKAQGLKRAFLIAYAECGSLITACNLANVHPTTVRGWLRNDELFLEEFDTATDNAVSMLEMEARRRALAGSDRLLEFLLKSLRPEVYRERYEVKQEISTDYIIDISQPDTSPDYKTFTSDSSSEIILGE